MSTEPNQVAAPASADLITDLTTKTEAEIEQILNVVKAYKAGGISAATAQAAPLLKSTQEEYAAVVAALPIIKAGWKTSEFWLSLLAPVGTLVVTKYFPTVSPSVAGVAVVTSGVAAAVYSISRSLVKNATVATVAGPAVTTTTTTK